MSNPILYLQTILVGQKIFPHRIPCIMYLATQSFVNFEDIIKNSTLH